MSIQTDPRADINSVLGADDQSNRRMSRNRWLVVIGSAVIILVAVFILISINGSAELRFTTREVTRGDLTVMVTATGTLQPTNEVDVGSELSGIIDSVYVDFNDNVRIGQPLARLDTEKLRAQVTQAQASLESARARALQAEASVKETLSKLEQLRKVRELSNNKVPSQSDLDAAEAAWLRAVAEKSAADAGVSQAEATLSANRTDLTKAVITSPINGVVLSRDVEPGQTVAASFTAPVLFTLAEDLTEMELHVDVDEADISKVTEGQLAEFTVAAWPDRSFKAVISEVRFGSSTTSGVVTYETVLTVDNSDLALRPGMTATADITVSRVEDAILVPNAALRFFPPMEGSREGEPPSSLVENLLPHPPGRNNRPRPEAMDIDGKQTVWTLENGELRPVPVTIGVTDGSFSAVLAGDIEPGMKVVTDYTRMEER
jgi:HlyD family secretion protein